MTTLEEQKRMLLPFLQRAQEIEKHDPRVAYYCRLYAVEQGVQIPDGARDPAIQDLLVSLVAKLEADKPGAGLEGEDADRAHVEGFALRVFGRADRADRAGAADKRTAVTFLAAFYFLEVLTLFGELDPDLAGKQRYAAWKAADINRALREGRRPTPGPPASEEGGSEAGSAGEAGPSMAGGGGFGGGFPAAPGGGASCAPPGMGGHDDGLPPPPPQAGQEEEEEAEEEDEFGLPSVPTGPPPMAGGGSSLGGGGAGTGLPPPPPAAGGPRYAPGSRVLYCEDGGASAAGGAQRGTVAMVEPSAPAIAPQHAAASCGGSDSGSDAGASADSRPVQQQQQHLYAVALKSAIARGVPECRLAPDLAPGDAALYRGALSAVVADVDIGVWPPSYTLVLEDGSERSAGPEHVSPAAPAAGDDAASDDGRGYQQQQRQQQQEPPPPPVPGASGLGGGGIAAGLAGLGLGAGGTGSAAAAGSAPPPPPSISAAGAPRHPPPPSAYPVLPPTQPSLPPAAATAAATAPSAPLPAPVPGFKPGLAAIAEAQKQAKYAASSLSFEDVPTAVKHLTAALALLTRPDGGSVAAAATGRR